MVVHAFITSRLDYCNSLYCGTSKSQIAHLQLVQNATARFLQKSHKSNHITPIQRAPHWLPIQFRIDFKILLFLYKSLHNQAPNSLAELLHPYNPLKTVRSSNQNLLLVPHSRLKHREDQAFFVLEPQLWNNLPLEIRLAPSLVIFSPWLFTAASFSVLIVGFLLWIYVQNFMWHFV